MVRMNNTDDSRKKQKEQKELENRQELAALNDGLSAFMNGSVKSPDSEEPEEEAAAGFPEAGNTATDTGRNLLLNQRKPETGNKSGPPKRRMGIVRVFLVLFLVLAILAGTGFGVFYFLREKGKNSLLKHQAVEGVEISGPEGAIVAEEGRSVIYNGKQYERNEDVISILCMGVDRDEYRLAKADELRIGEQGQADTIFVAAINIKTGKITMINISRDSMVTVDKYNVDGDYIGVEDLQICTAFAYGDGADSSCQNVSKSVSRLLYGIPMDAYGKIDVPAIGVLNDAVGGVTVTVLEDLANRNSALKKGATVTLTGDQARVYVRARDHATADANNARMQRQRQYLTAFIRKVLAAARGNLSIVFSLYQAAQSYMTTDLDISEMVYLTSLIMTRDFTSQNIITVPGEAVMGETYAEYYVDQDALYQIILDVYYNEIGEDGQVVQNEDDPENSNLVPEEEEVKEEKIITVDPSVLH